jgi:uncharacterized protein with NRDE domain
MCLLVLAYKISADVPCLLVGNRDELHARPSAPLGWWEGGDIAAGRDLVAGGAWLGANRAGRFAVVTNFPPIAAPLGAPSRGGLVPGFLASPRSPLEYLAEVAGAGARYAGFTLVVGDHRSVAYYSNAESAPRRLEPGVYGIGNARLDEDGRRLSDAKRAVAALVAANQADSHSLRAYFMRTDQDEGHSPFVLGPRYGTRCTTILRGSESGVAIEETRYSADGLPSGSVSLAWPTAG